MRAVLFGLIVALILAPLALALVLVPTEPPLPNAAAIGPPPPPGIPFPEYQECVHWIEKTDGPKARIDEWYRQAKTDGAAISIIVRAPGGRACIYKFDFVEGHLKLLVWRGPEGQKRLVPPGGALWPDHYIFRH